jgi:hypothetical protein
VRNARLFGDVTDPRRVEAFACEDANRRVEQKPPPIGAD